MKKLLKNDKISNGYIDKFLKEEVGIKFSSVLKDAGVFKQTNNGLISFKKFMTSLEN